MCESSLPPEFDLFRQKIFRLTFVNGVKIRNKSHNCYQNIPLPAQVLANAGDAGQTSENG